MVVLISDCTRCVSNQRGRHVQSCQRCAGGAGVFIPRFLNISEFSETGTCIGDIESEDEDLNTWEELLAEIDLQIAPRYRGYVGKVTLPDETSIEAVLWPLVLCGRGVP